MIRLLIIIRTREGGKRNEKDKNYIKFLINDINIKRRPNRKHRKGYQEE